MEVRDQFHTSAALPPGTHWTGAGLDAVVRRLEPPIIQPAAQTYITS